MKDCMTKVLKELEHKKTEEALNLVRKENDLWRYQHEEEEEVKQIAGRQDISKG